MRESGGCRSEGASLSLRTARHLAGLLAGTRSLTDSLAVLLAAAVQAVPVADEAGLIWSPGGRPATQVATTENVRELDDLQTRTGQGPAATASRSGQVVLAASLQTDVRWPRFAAQARKVGVQSALALPLGASGRFLGAFSLYACRPFVFDRASVQDGKAFAWTATAALRMADRDAANERLARRLVRADTGQAAVDRAVGLLMGGGGLGPAQALQQLHGIARDRALDVVATARALLQEADDASGAGGF